MPSGSPSEDLMRATMEARDARDSARLIEYVRYYPDRARMAARLLAEWGIEDAIPALVQMLRSASKESRRTAARALGDLGSPVEAREPLEDLALHDPDSAARAWALAALGKYRSDAAILPILLDALVANNWRVKNGAAVGLNELGDRQAIEPLRREAAALRRHPVRWYSCYTALDDAIRSLA